LGANGIKFRKAQVLSFCYARFTLVQWEKLQRKALGEVEVSLDKMSCKEWKLGELRVLFGHKWGILKMKRQ